jgi:hypothetical protein
MPFLDIIAERFRQEVIPDEHHNEDEIINHSINIEVLDCILDLLKLNFKVLSQNIHEYYLEIVHRLSPKVCFG